MVKVKTIYMNSNSDYELEKQINKIVGDGSVISLKQTDGYEWRLVYNSQDNVTTTPTDESPDAFERQGL